MNEIPPSTIIPNLVFGTVALVAGILIIIFRRRVRDFTLNGQRMMFGRRYSDATSGGQTTGAFLAVGIVFLLIAGGMLTGGITGLIQQMGH